MPSKKQGASEMKMTTVTNEWREMAIGVATSKGKTLTIKAQVFGCFALHQGLRSHADMWAITHVPTGKSVEHYNSTSYTSDEVKRIVEELQARKGDEWNTDSEVKARKMLVGTAHIWLDPKCERLEA
jgi:hypothetical protein